MEPLHLHSVFFAQTIGLYLLIMSIIMLLRRDVYRQFIENLKPTAGVIFTTASFSLIIGLIIVILHNRWVFNPDIAITLLGWIIVIKSILWLALPEEMVAYTRAAFRTDWYYVIVVILAIIGIFLMVRGFYPFMVG